MNEQTRGAALARVTPIAKESERSPMGAMKQLMQQQPDLLNMAIGEANFDPPRELVEIASRLMLDTVHRKNLYTSTRGLPSTREAIARFIERTWGVSVDPEQHILMTVGAMEALHLAIRILVDEGDTVLLPDPGWGVMVPLVTRRDGRVALLPAGQGRARHRRRRAGRLDHRRAGDHRPHGRFDQGGGRQQPVEPDRRHAVARGLGPADRGRPRPRRGRHHRRGLPQLRLRRHPCERPAGRPRPRERGHGQQLLEGLRHHGLAHGLRGGAPVAHPADGHLQGESSRPARSRSASGPSPSTWTTARRTSPGPTTSARATCA